MASTFCSLRFGLHVMDVSILLDFASHGELNLYQDELERYLIVMAERIRKES